MPTLPLIGCGGGSGSVGGSTGGGGTTGSTQAQQLNATAQFEVDVKSGKVTITPVKSAAKSPTGAPAAFRGTMIGFNSSLLVDEPGSTDNERKVLSVSLVNNTGETIGQLPSGQNTGMRVLFSSLTPLNIGVDLRPYSAVNTSAGNGSAGYFDGSTAGAEFSHPTGVAVAQDGSVWVTDYVNERIRRFSAGQVTTIAGSGNPSEIDGAGTTASFNGPWGIAYNPVDGSYVVTDYNGNKVRRVTAAGRVTTVAGTGSPGTTMGAGNAATFTHPSGVAISAAGAIYVSADDGIIRQITFTGTNRGAASSYTVASLAGSTLGYADGTGGAAKFQYPRGLAIDPQSNLYVADIGNKRIRLVNNTGEVTTIAGTGVAGTLDDFGGAATFSAPEGIAYYNGALFVSDEGGNKIRQMTLTSGTAPNDSANWLVETIAGSSTAGFANGAGSVATFKNPYFLTSDSHGNLYVADYGNNAVREVSPVSGTFPLGTTGFTTSLLPIHMFNVTGTIPSSQYGAGMPYVSYPGTLTPGQTSSPIEWGFDIPQADTAFIFSVTVEANTAVLAEPEAAFGAGSADNDVRTYVGGPVAGYGNGLPTEAQFDQPEGKTDRFGNIYMVEAVNSTVRVINSQGMTGLVAGIPGAFGGNDGLGNVASFYQPTDIAISPDGTKLFVAGGFGDTIRMITVSSPGSLDPTSYHVYTIAGQHTTIGAVDGNGAAALFSNPSGIVMTPSGNLYVADYGSSLIRKLTYAGDPTVPSNWEVQTVAGSANVMGDVNGTGPVHTTFNEPIGLACDLSGNVYIADQGNDVIRKMTPEGTVSNYAGTPGSSGYQDGATAKFGQLQFIAMSSSGYLYAADFINNVVRRVDTDGNVTTVAGVQSAPAADADGPGNTAKFNQPYGIMIDESGNLFVTEFRTSRIALVQRVLANNEATAIKR